MAICMVCTHVVNAGDSVAGMKWYELLCDASGSWSLVQEGLQSPDETTGSWEVSASMKME